MSKKKLVIALGGNALGNTPEEQLELVKETASTIVDLVEEGYDVVVGHGNGPQVGMINLAMEFSANNGGKTPAMPFPECGAMSQGYIGYQLSQAILNDMKRRGIMRSTACIVTQTVVYPEDPAFQNPTKPVGAFLTEEEAMKRAEETGYTDVTICCCFGTVFEQNIDWFEGDDYFQMRSYYYICRLNSDRRQEGKLEGYEQDMEYRGVKTTATEAFAVNRRIRREAWEKSREAGSRYLPRELDGLDRETEVLKQLKDLYVGKMIAQIYGCGQMIRHADRSRMVVDEKEGKANFVTDYDRRVQEEAERCLGEVFPEAVFVGEEEDVHASIEKGQAFIIDPIDGTTNFMKDYHASCISVGMTADGQRVAGVVYNPYLEEFYYAQKGRGAYCNGKAIHVSDEPLERGIVIFGTAPYYQEYADQTFALARKYFDKALDLRRSGSAAIDLCNVAAGRAELYFECVLSPWDFAAGSLIVEEAGGKVTTLEGGPLTLEKKCSVLATNGVVEKI